MAKASTLGIDLGTTYCCVAIYQNGRPEVIVNEKGSRTTPSYVAFTKKDRLFGEDAKNQAGGNPKNTIFNIKRIIGRRCDDAVIQQDIKEWPFVVKTIDNKFQIEVESQGEKLIFSPEQISAMILKKLKDAADAYMNVNHTDAVITVPAYFTNSQRDATRDAGIIAGLNVKRILNEPTAAALAFGINDVQQDEPRKVLIFDLGGGTFDVSILEIYQGNFDVKATDGDSHLGGEDFDRRLVNYFVNKFKEEFHHDLQKCEKTMNRLRKTCEDVKKTLSFATNAVVYFETLHGVLDTTISRDVFENLCDDLFQRTIEPTIKALAFAKYEKNEIDDIVLVGGSTRIPKIEKLLENFFGKKHLVKKINADEAVALGAAIQAAILDKEESEEIQNAVLNDVTPISLGIEIFGGKMSFIIDRNSTIPVKKSKIYTTSEDDQTNVVISVYQGENEMVDLNELLGEFEIGGITKMPKGEAEIDVTFEVNCDGILEVNAEELVSGARNKIKIAKKQGLRQNEIEKYANDIKRLDAKDKQNNELILARNSLHAFCLSIISNSNKENAQTDSSQKAIEKAQGTIDWLNKNPDLKKVEIENRKRLMEALDTPATATIDLS